MASDHASNGCFGMVIGLAFSIALLVIAYVVWAWSR